MGEPFIPQGVRCRKPPHRRMVCRAGIRIVEGPVHWFSCYPSRRQIASEAGPSRSICSGCSPAGTPSAKSSISLWRMRRDAAIPWAQYLPRSFNGPFSGSHILSAIRATEVVPKGNAVEIASLLFEIRDPGPPWGDRGVLQALQAFKAATEGLMDLCRRWCPVHTTPSP